MSAFSPDWFNVSNSDDVPSPALLVYPDRVDENLRRMIAIADGVARLRPHLKTHKMPELIRRQRALGLDKFKCATVAEAEMAALCGVPDLLLAYQPVGPNVRRLMQLVKGFPATRFATIADDPAAIAALSKAASDASLTIEVLLDIDCGQHRCGVEPGPKAIELYRTLAHSPGLKAGGLHVYDGHIHDSDPAARAANCAAAFAPVSGLRQQLALADLPVPRLVVGGTPTFPLHARRPDVECSPGTCVFWDAGYAAKMPDMPFLPAALLLTRIISKPGASRLCLDLGHKAVASEMPHPRVQLMGLEQVKFVTHSEEHLVIDFPGADGFAVGDCLYGVPWHICPTVALHSEAVVVRDGRAVESWKVSGRERRLTI